MCTTSPPDASPPRLTLGTHRGPPRGLCLLCRDDHYVGVSPKHVDGLEVTRLSQVDPATDGHLVVDATALPRAQELGVVVTDQRVRPGPERLPVSRLVSRRLPRLPLVEPGSEQDFRGGRFSEEEYAAIVKKPVDVAENGLRPDRAQPVNGVGSCYDVIVARPQVLRPRLVVEIELSVGARHSRLPVEPAADRQ